MATSIPSCHVQVVLVNAPISMRDGVRLATDIYLHACRSTVIAVYERGLVHAEEYSFKSLQTISQQTSLAKYGDKNDAMASTTRHRIYEPTTSFNLVAVLGGEDSRQPAPVIVLTAMKQGRDADALGAATEDNTSLISTTDCLISELCTTSLSCSCCQMLSSSLGVTLVDSGFIHNNTPLSKNSRIPHTEPSEETLSPTPGLSAPINNANSGNNLSYNYNNNTNNNTYRNNNPFKWDAMLIRTPYDKSARPAANMCLYWLSLGYIALAQDCRGRFASEGVFYKYTQEANDG